MSPEEPGLDPAVRALRLFRESPRVPLDVQRRIASVIGGDGHELGVMWHWRPSLEDKLLVEGVWADLTGGAVVHDIQGVLHQAERWRRADSAWPPAGGES